MKKYIGAALLAGAAVAGTTGVASAEVSGNVAMTTDYVWRGISQTSNNYAIQGGFDYSSGIFYAGTWGSNVDFGTGGSNAELDLYGGITPTVGPFSLDLGVVGYFYPGSDDSGGDLDFYELKAGATFKPVEPLELGATLYWTDDFGTYDSNGLYAEVSGSYSFSDMFAVSAAYGNQTIDNSDDDYSTWNIGGTLSLHGFDVDLRYHDTDIDGYDSIVNLTLSRSL